MKNKYCLFFLTLCCVPVLMAQSTTMTSTDSRAMGMGGAFVADSVMNPANLGFRGNVFALNEEKSDSQAEDRNGNPAFFMFNMFVAGEYVVSGDLLKIADETNDIIQRNGGIAGMQSLFTNPTGTSPSYTQIQDGLRLIDTISQLGRLREAGAFVDASGHADLFFMNIGFYFNTWGHAGIRPLVDTANLGYSGLAAFNIGGGDTVWGQAATSDGTNLTASQAQLAAQLLADNPGLLQQNQACTLVHQAAQAGINVDDPAFQDLLRKAVQSITNSSGSISNNQSGIKVLSFLMYEVNVSYGQSFLEFLSVGINLRALQAHLFREEIVLRNISKVEDLLADLRDGTYFDKKVRTLERFTMDLGFTVRPPLLGLSVSAYAKNVVPYSLNYPGGEDSVDIHTQFRLGLSYTFLNMFTVAADADLNRVNYDTVRGYKAQAIGGGIEFSPLPPEVPVSFVLRVGGFKNVADSNQDAVLTTGLGIKFWKFAVNAGGQVAWFKTVTIRAGDNDIDVYERAGFSVNFVFATDI